MAKKNGSTSKTSGKKYREITFLARVTVPADVTNGKALQLFRRVIDIGFEEAANFPDEWDDKDKPIVDVMTVTVK